MAENAFVKAPAEFQEGTKPAAEWEKWRLRYELYVAAIGYETKSATQQRALLLHTIGHTGYEIYRTFQFEEGEIDAQQTVKHIFDKFDEYYKPYKNVTFARYKFNCATQSSVQTIDQFVNEIKLLAKECSFDNLEDSLIRDRIVIGIKDDAMRERLLREDVSLMKAIDMCRAAETSKKHVKEMQDTADINAVSHDYNNKANNNSKGNPTREQNARASGSSYRRRGSNVNSQQLRTRRDNCPRCDLAHEPRASCPAYGMTCHKCKKQGHYARCCKGTAVRLIDTDVYSDDGSDGYHFVDTITVGRISNTSEWDRKIRVEGQNITFRLDTGADVNIMPFKVFQERFKGWCYKKSNTRIQTYTGERLQVKGACQMTCEFSNSFQLVTFYIVDGAHSPILGAQTCKDAGLILLANSLVISDQTQNILDEFHDVFEGMGRLPGIVSLKIKDDAQPTVAPARRIPWALQDQVKQELDRMKRLGIIERVTEPTEWVHPMVVARKKNGNIRICIDPRKLNEALQREHYPMPTPTEIFQKLRGSTIFTLADAQDGFWHLKLDEASSKMCTFNTPWGRFRFTVVPFGLKVAPELFQRAMDDAFEDVEGIQPYSDDIACGGKDIEDHNRKLRAMLKAARKNNVKFNKSKLQVGLDKINLLGHTISKDGISINEDRVKAVLQMPKPTSKQELQRFLGIINYMAKFLPHVSEEAANLRTLLKRDVEWQWNTSYEQIYQHLKDQVTRAPTLAIYDPSLPLTIAADASPVGLGAVLFQDGHPVEYASATLNQTQQNYSHIEKELMAVVFAVEHYHTYVFGRQITVQTDHKPLLGLQRKPMHIISPRMQRFIMRLQRYDIKLEYIPGKEMAIPDTLSRAPLPEVTCDLEEVEVVHALRVKTSCQKLEKLKQATRCDTTLKEVAKYISEGWPEHCKNLTVELKKFWKIRNELSSNTDLICKGEAVVIPENERIDVLRSLHKGHRGIVACKSKARGAVYWPGLNKDIEKMVQVCEPCAQHANNNEKEPLLEREVPDGPWQKVAEDFMDLSGKKFMLVIDYFSKFVELIQLNSTKAITVIMALRAIFARHGIPVELISDNGPPFDCAEFRQFCGEWYINHNTTSPLYPAANGQVERGVQTLKQALKKTALDGTDIYEALLDYRVTPVGNLPSPSEMLMGRRLRAFVPQQTVRYDPAFDTSDMYDELQNRQKKQTEKTVNRKELSALVVGDPVWLRKGKEWIKAMVFKRHTSPRSYIVRTKDGATYRRNRIHLRPRQPVNTNSGLEIENLFPYNLQMPAEQQVPGQQQEELDMERQRQGNTENHRRFTRRGREIKLPIRYR